MRGEIWAVAGGGDYTGKPRPAVIIQDDHFADTGSVTICPVTTDPTNASFFRILVKADDETGLDSDSSVMADKLTTVRRSRLGNRVGRISDDDLVRLERAIMLFLGLATPRSRARGR